MGRRGGGGGGDAVAIIARWLAKHLGACISVQTAADGDAIKTKNDYELVVRTSKELENVLEVYFGARGKGLHEKASSVEGQLSRDLVRKIRYLATIRNKLVHEYGFNEIDDRATFINNFTSARAEMKSLLAQRAKRGAGKQPADICAIM